jgi:carbon-monoxide dehydrogenase small subunit
MTRTVQYAGAHVAIDAPPEASLLEIARRELGVRSASAPSTCDDGRCGACRLIVDGQLKSACRVRWADVRDGATVEAYEQLAEDEAAARAVDAFAAERPTRCRMCIGALGVTAVALARAGKEGDPVAVEETLATATCMCTGRGSLRRALLAKGTGATPESDT